MTSSMLHSDGSAGVLGGASECVVDVAASNSAEVKIAHNTAPIHFHQSLMYRVSHNSLRDFSGL